jgi:hypothetical protein
MAAKSEKIWTTKEADRLWISWANMVKKAKALNLPNLKAPSLAEKDFKPLADEMTKSKKGGDWIWEFDFDSFDFEYNVVVGSKSLLVASAKMNTVEMSDRRDILDSLKNGTKLVTQADIDKYFKQAEQRSDIRKIDEAIKKIQTDIDSYENAKKLQKPKSDDLTNQELRLDLKEYAKTVGKVAYVDFMIGVDSGWNPAAIMGGHFLHGAKEHLSAVPEVAVEKLRKDWADGKGKVDFGPIRKFVGAWVDKNLMPGFVKQTIADLDKGIREMKAQIVKLQAQRNKLMGY